MLGANELPLRQVFGLCPKRLYGALVSPARRPVPVRRKISRLTQYFIKITTPFGVVIFMDTVRTSHARRK